jgi:hypothetical protein
MYFAALNGETRFAGLAVAVFLLSRLNRLFSAFVNASATNRA